MNDERRGLPPVLLRFAWALVAMAALSIFYTKTMTHALRLHEPFGVTLFHGEFVGSDFKIFAERSHHFRTPSYWDEYNYPFTYPAPLALVFAAFYALPQPLSLYIGLCVAGLLVWAVWVARGLTIAGVHWREAAGFAILILLLSWPVVLLLNTANMEGLLAIVLSAGVYAVLRDRLWLGATLIGLAASMKLFPFMLLALLLSRRRYKEFAGGLVVAALATLVSLAVVGPTILVAQHQIADGFRFVQQAFVLSTQRDALNYSHSLFSLLKFTLFFFDRSISQAALAVTLRLYMIGAAIGGTVLYYKLIRRLPMLNQVLALTICAVLLPPLSADYTLLELLLPFGLLCVYAVETGRADLTPVFACFAMLFGWETFFTIRYSFDRPARTVALCVLLVLVLRKPLAWARLDEARQVA